MDDVSPATDAWSIELLTAQPMAQAAVQKAIRDKVLESYCNGQRACPKCNPRTPRRPAPAS